MPMMSCHKCYGPATFIKSQGFTIKNSVFYQDNLCALLLEQNMMESRSSKTKHISVRCYFIKDRIAAGNIVATHCPTR